MGSLGVLAEQVTAGNDPFLELIHSANLVDIVGFGDNLQAIFFHQQLRFRLVDTIQRLIDIKHRITQQLPEQVPRLVHVQPLHGYRDPLDPVHRGPFCLFEFIIKCLQQFQQFICIRQWQINQVQFLAQAGWNNDLRMRHHHAAGPRGQRVVYVPDRPDQRKV